MSKSTDTARRIYVACLASYNNGVLHGEWIDAEQDADGIWSDVNEMLRKSPYPNVHVDCPDCNYDGAPDELVGHDGEGTADGRDDTCLTCKGTGKVPSAEEWAIHDYEGFEGIKLSEHESFETVAALSEAIEEHGVAFAAWWNNENRDEVDLDAFQECYRGEFDSLADYVEDYWDQCGEYKRDNKNWWSPINYVDWERMARDLQMSGDVWTHEEDGKVYVFDNH